MGERGNGGGGRGSSNRNKENSMGTFWKGNKHTVSRQVILGRKRKCQEAEGMQEKKRGDLQDVEEGFPTREYLKQGREIWGKTQ